MLDLVDIPVAAMALAAAGLVPLVLAAVDDPDRDGRRAWALRWARRLSWPGAAGVVASVAVAPGALAVALVAPYALTALLAACHGAGRLAARGLRPAGEVAIAAGLLYVAGAATWLVACRAGVALMGYPPYWVALTATHFHVAGVALPVVVGLHLRAGAGRLARAAAWTVVFGVPATAIGIAWSRTIEVGAAVALAGAALVIVWRAAGAARRHRGAVGALHALAAAALAVSMPLAAAYALRLDLRLGGLTALDTMAVTHGACNLLFAIASLAAFVLVPAPPRWRPGVPRSRLIASRRVGADYFERLGVGSDRDVRGLVDDLDELAHPALVTSAVAPAIRAFYERTTDHVLRVTPRWRLGFRTGARVWAWWARRLGQLELPRADVGAQAVGCRLVALAASRDGRASPRGWVRCYPDGRPMYVAAYATHRAAGVGYMNIAFPLPGGQLASVMRMDPAAGAAGAAGAVVLTSHDDGTGDAGLYLALRLGRRLRWLRLPMHETLALWTAAMAEAPPALRAMATPATTVLARHELTLLGVRYLTLDYVIGPAPR
ncbi:MAG: YndJ family transporter [Kofleriaceae bacterium]|nr:YndJ family transporter [Kofleriaceae bacterium]MCB9574983.1 YndJ family transporter [Kofleriaceae bacterium]